MQTTKPVVLCILDGWGQSSTIEGNAPALAKTPTMDKILQECPNAQLITYGPDVGLPSGQMGNSEVGHMNIGAGRVVAMDLGQIDLAIQEGSYTSKAVFQEFLSTLQETGGTAHLLGLVSDGGVHGHISHLIATALACDQAGVPVCIHALGDGRDVAPKSMGIYLDQLKEALPQRIKIATITGRYFALDRDNRWERVQTSYEAIVHANAKRQPNAIAALEASYENGQTDEFIEATVLGDYQGMRAGDGLFCLNFRADRAREIMAALAQPDFDAFTRKSPPQWSFVLGMSPYSIAHDAYVRTMFPKENIVNTLGAWVAAHGKSQFRLAETEKYPHVTFFFNGGVEPPEAKEERFMPHSPKVATYDLQPEMSCPQVTEKFVEAIHEGYDLIVVNYANPDMVGHTGDLDAAIEACEAVDQGLAQVINALNAVEGTMIVTADHGNCETMIDPQTKTPHTAHTLNPVPVALVNGPQNAQLSAGRLADLAPTILHLMGLEKPAEMTGNNLIS